MLSLPDVHVDAEGNVVFASSDHNAWVVSGPDLLTNEPSRVGVSGPGDAFSIFSVGSGPDKVSILCAVDDKSPVDEDADVVFHRGEGVPDAWTTTNYQVDGDGMGVLETGEVPRPGGVFGWDNGDGTYSFVVWSDGIGFTRSNYNLATDRWSTWAPQESGPSSDLVTDDLNQERMIVGDPDGTLLVGLQLTTGSLWRSIDGGVNWESIAPSISAAQEVRKGRIAYSVSGDWLIVSDSEGLHRVSNVSTTADATTISGVTAVGPVAIDSQGRYPFGEPRRDAAPPKSYA